jgi:hypothetical protein
VVNQSPASRDSSFPVNGRSCSFSPCARPEQGTSAADGSVAAVFTPLHATQISVDEATCRPTSSVSVSAESVPSDLMLSAGFTHLAPEEPQPANGCFHTLHLIDEHGTPCGSWIDEPDGNHIRVVCRVCGKFYGYRGTAYRKPR